MRTLIALLLTTSTALGGWNTAKPTASFVTAKPSCPCGIAGCSCPAGECDCGATVKESLTVQKPHIIATVASRGCPPCERWKSETLPKLIEAGWRVEIREVPLNSQSVPSFEFQGRKLDGYGGRDEFYAWLRSPVSPTGVASSAPVAASVGFQPAPVQYKTVVRSDMHEHRCRACGTTWSHSDRMNGSYSAHTCPGCGRLEWSQSSGVARVLVPVSGGYVRSQPARQYASRAVYRSPVQYANRGCPGGCP